MTISTKEVERKLKERIAEVLKSSVESVSKPEEVAALQEAYVSQPKVYHAQTDSIKNSTMDGHTELYKKYIQSINEVNPKIDSAGQKLEEANSNHSNIRSLKQDEAFLLNAIYLHELYFSNCFSKKELYEDSNTFVLLQREWGEFNKWQKEFQAIALSSRCGWVCTGYSLYLKKIINVFIDGHDKGIPVGFIPMIVVDMWEHAYFADFGLDKRSYLISQMKEINWDVVEERVTKIKSIMEVYK